MLVLHVVYFAPPVKLSSTQDYHFPGFSRTKLIFQTFQSLKINFQGPGKSRKTIPGFSERHENPAMVFIRQVNSTSYNKFIKL